MIGASEAVNRDLGALSRMFTLALQAGRLSRRPNFPRLPEGQPRQGFMEHGAHLALRSYLPAEHQDVLDFGYLTGRVLVLSKPLCDLIEHRPSELAAP